MVNKSSGPVVERELFLMIWLLFFEQLNVVVLSVAVKRSAIKFLHSARVNPQCVLVYHMYDSLFAALVGVQ